MIVSVSEENVSGIDTHFRKYRIGGIDTFGIVSPITTSWFLDYRYFACLFSWFTVVSLVCSVGSPLFRLFVQLVHRCFWVAVIVSHWFTLALAQVGFGIHPCCNWAWFAPSIAVGSSAVLIFDSGW